MPITSLIVFSKEVFFIKKVNLEEYSDSEKALQPPSKKDFFSGSN
jgi:hypothetical protein